MRADRAANRTVVALIALIARIAPMPGIALALSIVLGALGAAALAWPAAPVHAQAAANSAPLDLDTLLATIARQTVPHAKFYERKRIALLEQPVDSVGELLFVAPSRLEKRTLSPQAETMVIDGDAMTLERGGMRRSLSLQQLPEAVPLVDSLRGTLSGDRKLLERSFRITLGGTLESWSMKLVPLQPRAQRLVREVRLSGLRGWVTQVEIDQTDGDSSVMRVQPQP